MNLPDQIQKFIHPKQKLPDIFLTLVFEPHALTVGGWEVSAEKKVHVITTKYASCSGSWEEKLEKADELIVAIEKEVGREDLNKAVLGFTSEYLSTTGDIEKSIRLHIKKLTRELLLEPLGFVAIHSAINFHIKKEEGVPASVILLHNTKVGFEIQLYKVGVLIGETKVEKSEFVVDDVEKAIKSFKDIEVLPSRIYIYGGEGKELDRVKNELLKHPWTNRTNFLHYPKIEVLTPEYIINAVSFAGASELALTMTEEKDEDVVEEVKETPFVAPVERKMERTVVPVIQKEAAPEIDAVEDTEEKEEIEKVETAEADDNLSMVDREVFGFEAEDVLEDSLEKPNASVGHIENGEIVLDEIESEERESDEEIDEEEESVLEIPSRKKLSLPKISLPSFPHISLSASGKPLVIGLIILLLAGLGIGGYTAYTWYLVKATITISVIPHTTEQSKVVGIDTEKTTVDEIKGIIPGKKVETSITVEKVGTVNGKKKVGDPARGTVIIYNKLESERILKKGTVITSGSLQFMIDEETKIASASMNKIEGISAAGKSTVGVTATSIGAEGNLTSRTEFTIKDIPPSSAYAINDAAFSGGKSRDITVVTRADYDALVKAATDEVGTKAKTELVSGVGEKEKLIESTIKTVVTAKVFTEELDAEATALHGKITITATGITYSENDIKTLLLSSMSKDIPSGFIINEQRTTTTLGEVTTKKDGSMTVNAKMNLVSLPQIDSVSLQDKIAGKSIDEMTAVVKSIQGVAGVTYDFANGQKQTSLPKNKKNITLIVSIQQ